MSQHGGACLPRCFEVQGSNLRCMEFVQYILTVFA